MVPSLNPQPVRKVRIQPFSATRASRQGFLPDEDGCPICLDPIRDPVASMCCGKMYCRSCITGWARKTNHCPWCEKEMALMAATDGGCTCCAVQ